MGKKAQIIFTPQLARFLLKQGFTMIDLKPDKTKAHDSIYVFRNDEGLQEAMTEFISAK